MNDKIWAEAVKKAMDSIGAKVSHKHMGPITLVLTFV